MNKKVTRLQVLEKAKEYMLVPIYEYGICYALTKALVFYEVIPEWAYFPHTFLKNYIPLFTIRRATKFGAKSNIPNGYWWTPGYLGTGRIDFLNWLIEEYKDDDTNLMDIHA